MRYALFSFGVLGIILNSSHSLPGAEGEFRQKVNPAPPQVANGQSGEATSPATQPPVVAVQPRAPEQSLENSIGMRFKLIEPGKFLMGSKVETKIPGITTPVHEVTLTQPFYLGVYEVTQEQYERTMRMNPSSVKAPKRAVDKVDLRLPHSR